MPYKNPNPGFRRKPAFPELTASRVVPFNPDLPPACFPTLDANPKPATAAPELLSSPTLVGSDLVDDRSGGSKEEHEIEGEVTWKDIDQSAKLLSQTDPEDIPDGDPYPHTNHLPIRPLSAKPTPIHPQNYTPITTRWPDLHPTIKLALISTLRHDLAPISINSFQLHLASSVRPTSPPCRSIFQADYLTLPNRANLYQQIEKEIRQQAMKKTQAALLRLDLSQLHSNGPDEATAQETVAAIIDYGIHDTLVLLNRCLSGEAQILGSQPGINAVRAARDFLKCHHLSWMEVGPVAAVLKGFKDGATKREEKTICRVDRSLMQDAAEDKVLKEKGGEVGRDKYDEEGKGKERLWWLKSKLERMEEGSLVLQKTGRKSVVGLRG